MKSIDKTAKSIVSSDSIDYGVYCRIPDILHNLRTSLVTWRVLFSYLVPFSSYLQFLFTMGFYYLRQFCPILGHGPQNYELVAWKSQKVTCTNGIAPLGAKNFSHERSPCVRRIPEKKITTKAKETTRIYLGISSYRGAPTNWASTMKLGEFRKIPDIIKRVKRHLGRTHSFGFARRSYLAYAYA